MIWSQEDAKKTLAQMKLRASCRSFLDKEIPSEILDDIIEAGLCAASGGNLQPVSIIKITDREKSKKLAELNGNQLFIAQAPVNLLFVLDWYKMGIFAENEKAPYTAYDSYMHFIIALEDLMCCAQTIETAAFLYGIGSCYVGTTSFDGEGHAREFNLPERSYPLVLLSLGYPKAEIKPRKKLSRDLMVFDEKYPDFTENKDFVIQGFRDKYGDQSLKLPSDGEKSREMLETFRTAMLTTFSEAEADEIIAEIRENGMMNETQRRFGLHYHAEEMRNLGRRVMQNMENIGLTPFRK